MSDLTTNFKLWFEKKLLNVIHQEERRSAFPPSYPHKVETCNITWEVAGQPTPDEAEDLKKLGLDIQDHIYISKALPGYCVVGRCVGIKGYTYFVLFPDDSKSRIVHDKIGKPFPNEQIRNILLAAWFPTEFYLKEEL